MSKSVDDIERTLADLRAFDAELTAQRAEDIINRPSSVAGDPSFMSEPARSADPLLSRADELLNPAPAEAEPTRSSPPNIELPEGAEELISRHNASTDHVADHIIDVLDSIQAQVDVARHAVDLHRGKSQQAMRGLVEIAYSTLLWATGIQKNIDDLVDLVVPPHTKESADPDQGVREPNSAP
jgi:hypothetical protein